MQVKSERTRPGSSRSRLLCLVVPLLALMMSACAFQQPMYRFRVNSISKISYDPRNCVEMPDGKFKCKDVVFTVKSIEPIKDQSAP